MASNIADIQKAFPPRHIDEEIKRQVGDIAPYRAVVSLRTDESFEVEWVGDEAELDGDIVASITHIIAVSRPIAKLYPVQTAIRYAKAAFGILDEISDANILCIDGRIACLDEMPELDIKWLYTDDETLACQVFPILSPDVLATTYREKIIYKGKPPVSVAERYLLQDRYWTALWARKKTQASIECSLGVAETAPRQYFSSSRFGVDDDLLLQIAQALCCGQGNTQQGFPECPNRPPENARTELKRFCDEEVAFPALYCTREELDIPLMDYEMLTDMTDIWSKVVFQDKISKLYELAHEINVLPQLAEKFAIDSYTDALAAGISKEDLLA